MKSYLYIYTFPNIFFMTYEFQLFRNGLAEVTVTKRLFPWLFVMSINLLWFSAIYDRYHHEQKTSKNRSKLRKMTAKAMAIRSLSRLVAEKSKWCHPAIRSPQSPSWKFPWESIGSGIFQGTYGKSSFLGQPNPHSSVGLYPMVTLW